MIVVLVPAAEAEPSLRPAAVSKLWAFDPERSREAVTEAVAGGTSRARARTLVALVEMAVSTARGGERS